MINENMELTNWLGFYVGTNLMNEFVKDFDNSEMSNEKLKCLTIVPMKFQVWEIDKNTNKKVLKNRLGFNLYKELERAGKPEKNGVTFVFDRNFNVQKANDVMVEIDISDKDSIDDFKRYEKEINKFKCPKEFAMFMNLATRGCTLMFLDNGEKFYLKTKDVKALWRNNVKSSTQVNEMQVIAKEIKENINDAKKEIERGR